MELSQHTSLIFTLRVADWQQDASATFRQDIVIPIRETLKTTWTQRSREKMKKRSGIKFLPTDCSMPEL
jgi:hypothetical protein